MSYNHAKLRSLQISQEVQPLSSRNPNSSRTKPISLLSSHILSQGLTSSSIQNLDDNISSITTERQRASVSTKRSQLIGTTNVDKENINSDADDLFDNFDRCYRASYSTTEKSVKENKSLPVCRDLLSEFAADATKASSGLSGVKTPLAFGNSSHFQRPKEFQVSKAGRYFDMKTPSNNNGLTKIHNIGLKNEEDVENEDEEHRQINVKNILTRRSANYEMEQKTLNKLKKGDYRIEIPNQRRVLDDVTNNTERHTHKPSVHEGVESNRINFMEMFTRRGTVGKQTLVEKKKNSVVQNGQLETKKINIPGMLALASLQKRENLQPPTRNSYNGRGSESHRVISHKEVEKPASVPRKDQNIKYNSKPKAVSGRNSARLEHENKGSRGSVKVYESLMRYFEIAKKELSRSKSNGKRSSSENRR